MTRFKQLFPIFFLPACLGGLLVLAWPSATLGHELMVQANPPPIRINEFMAENVQTLQNPDDEGEFDDWIELYNGGTEAVDLDGYYLTDDLSDLTKHQISGTLLIEPDEYLLLFADNHSELGANHLEFKLRSEGESIGLVLTDGLTLIDSYTFMTTTADVSIGRNEVEEWVEFTVPTPGESNSTAVPEIFSVSRTPEMPNSNEPITISTVAMSGSSIGITTTLNYRISFGPWVKLNMSAEGGSGYSAVIPGQSQNELVDYYIVVEDQNGLVVRSPFSAPDLLHQVVVDYEKPTVRINEFMADNASTFEDPLKLDSFPDWIELLNYGDSEVVLTGMQLTDNFTNKSKYTIPAGVALGPGEALLLIADNDPEEGLFHIPFSLRKEGEVIGLYDSAVRGTTLIDSVEFGPQAEDQAYVRCGETNWRIGPASPQSSNLCLNTFLPFAAE